MTASVTGSRLPQRNVALNQPGEAISFESVESRYASIRLHPCAVESLAALTLIVFTHAFGVAVTSVGTLEAVP